MIIDPHIAVIRIPASAGADFYDRVVERIAHRREQPQGVLLHFSAQRGGEFIVGTVFRDNASMLEGFLAFSSMESQNVMVERGAAFDLTRDTYPLERLFVEPGVATMPFGMSPAGSVVAKTSELDPLDLARYHQVTRELGWFDKHVPGRICHLAYSDQGRVRTIDFWESREIGQAVYEDQAYPAFDLLHPGERSAERGEASWMELHTFLVENNANDVARHFVRETSGPVAI